MNFLLDFRESNVGGAVVPGRLVGDNVVARAALAGHERVIFLIHGFNVDRVNGTATLTRLANALALTVPSAYVSVLWPGDHWLNFLSYSFEGNDADDTGAELARYINDVIPSSADLSFVSHSLGARVVLETIERLRPQHRVSEVCLLAPAVDDFSIAAPRIYRDAVMRTRRLAVLASRKDAVLRFAYPAGDLLQSFLFIKDEAGFALGYHGPRARQNDTIPVQVYHVQIPDGLNCGHGGYLPDAQVTGTQRSAGDFVRGVLRGLPQPPYA